MGVVDASECVSPPPRYTESSSHRANQCFLAACHGQNGRPASRRGQSGKPLTRLGRHSVTRSEVLNLRFQRLDFSVDVTERRAGGTCRVACQRISYRLSSCPVHASSTKGSTRCHVVVTAVRYSVVQRSVVRTRHWAVGQRQFSLAGGPSQVPAHLPLVTRASGSATARASNALMALGSFPTCLRLLSGRSGVPTWLAEGPLLLVPAELGHPWTPDHVQSCRRSPPPEAERSSTVIRWYRTLVRDTFTFSLR